MLDVKFRVRSAKKLENDGTPFCLTGEFADTGQETEHGFLVYARNVPQIYADLTENISAYDGIVMDCNITVARSRKSYLIQNVNQFCDRDLGATILVPSTGMYQDALQNYCPSTREIVLAQMMINAGQKLTYQQQILLQGKATVGFYRGKVENEHADFKIRDAVKIGFNFTEDADRYASDQIETIAKITTTVMNAVMIEIAVLATNSNRKSSNTMFGKPYREGYGPMMGLQNGFSETAFLDDKGLEALAQFKKASSTFNKPLYSRIKIPTGTFRIRSR